MPIPDGNPQIENGHIDIANELAEALAMINISSYESRVLWIILRKTYGWHKKSDWISLSQFVELTGLTKPHIIRAIKKLVSKNIITQIGNDKGKEYSINKHYKNWKSLPKEAIVTQIGNHRCLNRQSSLPKEVPTKETITKETIQKKILFAEQKFQNITEEKIQKWSEAYPGIDIKSELKKMEVWLTANPKNKKENHERFIVNWLSRSLNNKKGGKDGKYISINSGERKGGEADAGKW
jgi:phage replication O-like protein O